ncbi:MAG TPA: DUF2652 domain-containing protein [Candidatus Limnocylindrales bacterium]|nr:DUF2652 domain-containing protein [Candidatus Limnocylindrales bacterium]
MSIVPTRPVGRSGALLLADISGYTGFLGGVADAHRALIVESDEPPAAYAVLSHLLDTIIAAIEPHFQVVKLEGDAVFAVGDAASLDGLDVLACMRGCYAAFRRELAKAGSQWTCTCEACVRVGDLDLKFVLHDGRYVSQSIGGREELLGHDVNLVHRLLKNHARELIGPMPYALITDAAAVALLVPTDEMVEAEERYDDTPPVRVHILALGVPAAVPQ